ncbi:MAG: FISUMP domain-containing protein, partial [Bacteroidota bacterium]|nr:FISUMP domain-containing protein [Bacteroidota bacterium]
MKKILLLSLLFQAIFANAQNIENFITQQKGGELIITYDLISSKDEFFNLDLLYAVKNNKWKSIKNKYGEFGDSIKPGKNKHIMLWVDDLKLNENEKVKFMLVAVHNAIEPRKNGSLNDSENNTYKWIRYEDTRWMVSNLKTQVDGASLTNDEILYSAHAAHNACPELWKLPSDKDWKKLERNLGMSASQVKDFGLRKANLQNFIDSGFTLNPIDYNISIYKNDDILAFWSSTHNQNYYWNSDKF